MIHYVYDPLRGAVIRDCDALAVMEDQLFWEKLYTPDNDPSDDPVVFIGGTENSLHALRVLIKRGEIALERVRVFYRTYNGDEAHDRELKVYANGGIRPWPKGIADTQYWFLMELITQE